MVNFKTGVFYTDKTEVKLGDVVEVTDKFNTSHTYETTLELGLEEITGDNYNYVPCIVIIGSDGWKFETIQDKTIVTNIKKIKGKI